MHTYTLLALNKLLVVWEKGQLGSWFWGKKPLRKRILYACLLLACIFQVISSLALGKTCDSSESVLTIQLFSAIHYQKKSALVGVSLELESCHNLIIVLQNSWKCQFMPTHIPTMFTISRFLSVRHRFMSLFWQNTEYKFWASVNCS